MGCGLIYDNGVPLYGLLHAHEASQTSFAGRNFFFQVHASHHRWPDAVAVWRMRERMSKPTATWQLGTCAGHR